MGFPPSSSFFLFSWASSNVLGWQYHHANAIDHTMRRPSTLLPLTLPWVLKHHKPYKYFSSSRALHSDSSIFTIPCNTSHHNGMRYSNASLYPSVLLSLLLNPEVSYFHPHSKAMPEAFIYYSNCPLQIQFHFVAFVNRSGDLYFSRRRTLLNTSNETEILASA